MLSSSLQYSGQDLRMVFSGLGLDKNVINIHFHVHMHHVMEYSRHSPLVCGSSILETKRHDYIAVNSPWCGERGFLLIFFSKADLIISRKSVHEGQHLVASGVVDQDINMG